jgi:hypothetical protein
MFVDAISNACFFSKVTDISAVNLFEANDVVLVLFVGTFDHQMNRLRFQHSSKYQIRNLEVLIKSLYPLRFNVSLVLDFHKAKFMKSYY